MSKQRCRMLQMEQFFRRSQMLLRGNNVERNFVFLTKSKQIERVQFVSTLSKWRNFVRHCCRFGNKVECCFDKVERCFDIVAVALILLLGWTGLYSGLYFIKCKPLAVFVSRVNTASHCRISATSVIIKTHPRHCHRQQIDAASVFQAPGSRNAVGSCRWSQREIAVVRQTARSRRRQNRIDD